MSWTARLEGRVVDLRYERSADRLAMVEERPPFECRGCDARMHLRHYDFGTDTDPRRFRYFDDRTGPFVAFVHNPGCAEACRALGHHVDESAEHLDLKHAISEAVQAKGWDAELEVYSSDRSCRADVVISHRSEQTRAIEAQISSLGVDAAVRRHELYNQHFGRTLWTHTKQRPWSRRLPSVRVDTDDTSLVIGGVYVDQTLTTTIEDAPLAGVLPRILPPDRELMYVWLDENVYGGFVPVSMAEGVRRGGTRKHRRRTKANGDKPDKPAGHSVRECDGEKLGVPDGLYTPNTGALVHCRLCPAPATTSIVAPFSSAHWPYCDHHAKEVNRIRKGRGDAHQVPS